MPQPSISFLEGQGGLGRPLANNDHISALLFLNVSTLPSGFASTSTATRCKALYSVDDAIAAGILKDYSDATAATGVYTFTAVGGNGDTVELKIADINVANGATQSTSLGVFTKTAAETTLTLLAAAYVAVINAGTATHGYSATNSAGAVTITAPKRLGAYLNGTTSISATIVGTMTGTITTQMGAAVAGVASKMVQYYYQISEFFRMQPKGKLWVGFFGTPVGTFSEITDMQNNAAGEIRNFGVFKDGTWAVGDLALINTICNTNKAQYQPCYAVYAANLQATTDITTINDLSTLTSNNVQTCIGQDGYGWGNFLYLMNGTAGKKSITCLGAQLGTIAACKVSESQAEVGKRNLSSGVELEVPAFCNGQLVSALSYGALEALNTKRHVFIKKFTGYQGTYFQDSHSACLPTSDYYSRELNATIQKVERLLYPAYLPKLNSQLVLNANGTLSDITVADLESIGDASLDQMIRDGELSARDITVSTTQNVLATSTVSVKADIVPMGIMRTIIIPIQYKTQLTQ
jgi:hypothetical protein